MKSPRNKYILNLFGELSETLKDYFQKSNFSLITREEATEYENIDFILVATEDEVKQAFKDYSAQINDIEIICLGLVKAMKDFLLHNGRLVFDNDLIESQLGELCLNKFFFKNHSIHLFESFSNLISDTKEFQITNHLSAGLFVDEISTFAFENGFNIVALRSFMDHLIYYFTYLKQASLAGIPYEVEYGNDKNYFVVNMVCPVRNFVAEYMIDSFGSVNSKDPLQYLLGIVASSTDFLEITHIEKPGRLVVTAIWQKDQNKNFSGLSFNNILTTSQTIAQLNKKVETYIDTEEKLASEQAKQELLKSQTLPGGILDMVLADSEDSIFNNQPEKVAKMVAFVIAKYEEEYPDQSINDIEKDKLESLIAQLEDDDLKILTEQEKDHLLERVKKNNIIQAYDEEIQRVRDDLEEKSDVITLLNDTLFEEVAQRVAEDIEADTINKILGGQDLVEENVRVGGSIEDADDFMVKVSSYHNDEKQQGLFKTSLKSSFLDKAEKFNVKMSSGTSQDKKEALNWLVKESVEDAARDAGMDIKVQAFLEQNALSKTETLIEKYAPKKESAFQGLCRSDLENFFDNELTDVLRVALSDKNAIKEFGEKIEQGISIDLNNNEKITPEKFEEKLRYKLQHHLKTSEHPKQESKQYVFSREDISNEKIKDLIKVTLKETMSEEFQLENASTKEIEKIEEDLIENLSLVMQKQKENVAQYVKPGVQKAKQKEAQLVVDNLFQENSINHKDTVEFQINSTNLSETALIKELKKKDQENARLQKKISSMEIELNSFQTADKMIEQMNFESSEETFVQISEHAPDILQKKESQLKKLQIENQKQLTLFRSQILKNERAIKVKDTIITKLKENMGALVKKQELEITRLTRQVEDLNQRLNNDESITLKREVKSLTKEVESQNRKVQLYKNKLEVLMNSKNNMDTENHNALLTEENRQLKALKNQLNNKVSLLEKQSKSRESRYNNLMSSESKLRSDNIKIKSELKDLEQKLKASKVNEARLEATAEKAQMIANSAPTPKEVTKLKDQISTLQQKLKEIESHKVAKHQPADGKQNNSALSAKEKHLEKSNQRLQSEIGKARTELDGSKKEVIKLKAETTALKNKIKVLEKDIEKMKKGKNPKEAA